MTSIKYDPGFFKGKDVKTTMIYTHVLNRGPAGSVAPSMRFEGVREDFMLIRIRHRDKDSALTQRPDISPVRTEAMIHLQASYTAIATVFGMLCGSI